MVMVTAIFFITTIVCATGWIASHIAAESLVIYMKKKGYTAPNKEEVDACTREAVNKLFLK